MAREFNVVPGVQVLRVEQDGPVITADVFGGDDPVVIAEVEFLVDDAARRRRVMRMFRDWEVNARPLTLIEREDGDIALVDDASSFRAAAEG